MSNEGLDEKTQEFGGKYFGEGEDESGTENDRESFPVENDGKTSSSNKRIKEMPIDGFSELPDSLLIHILSFLRLKEAAITSVLSKRWRFLWSYLPRLEFWEGSADTEKLRRFVSWVHRTLVIRTGNYLEKFEVGFRYDKCFASDLDFCVEFVVKNKVKEFILLLDFYKDFYMLPEVIYSNSSLTSLRLQGCMMAPERTIEWQSLTKLSLNEVELNQHAIEEILSGCPVLYSLELESCWGFNRLEVNSRSLYRLTIEDSEDDDEPLLEISAPYIQTLDILLYPEGRKLQLRNIPSLVRADIDFNGYGWDSSSVEVMSYLKELFENMQHVKELVLGRQCFKVVSMLAVNGWQLPQSRRRCLSVYSSSEYKHNISGIIYLLESSPDLEALIIEGYFTYRKYPTLDPAAKGDLDCDLLHLKTVNIRNFADPKGEPLLTLARILLKRATVLEEMVIVTDVKDTSDFSKIGQTLLAYPRSSQKAVVTLLNDRAVVMPEEFIRRHCTCLVVV